jgi:hypothetical protein
MDERFEGVPDYRLGNQEVGSVQCCLDQVVLLVVEIVVLVD